MNYSFSKDVFDEPDFKRYDDLCKSIILMNLCSVNPELIFDDDTSQVAFYKLQNRFDSPGVFLILICFIVKILF